MLPPQWSSQLQQATWSPVSPTDIQDCVSAYSTASRIYILYLLKPEH